MTRSRRPSTAANDALFRRSAPYESRLFRKSKNKKRGDNFNFLFCFSGNDEQSQTLPSMFYGSSCFIKKEERSAPLFGALNAQVLTSFPAFRLRRRRPVFIRTSRGRKFQRHILRISPRACAELFFPAVCRRDFTSAQNRAQARAKDSARILPLPISPSPPRRSRAKAPSADR